MKARNAQASDKKRDERKAFMSQCLAVLEGRRGHADDSAGEDDEVQRRCERQVARGDHRKAFLSSCPRADKMPAPFDDGPDLPRSPPAVEPELLSRDGENRNLAAATRAWALG